MLRYLQGKGPGVYVGRRTPCPVSAGRAFPALVHLPWPTPATTRLTEAARDRKTTRPVHKFPYCLMTTKATTAIPDPLHSHTLYTLQT